LRTSEPAGTSSQIVALESNGDRIERVHWYHRPDGKIGGSDRPDPKELFEDVMLFDVK